MPTKDDVREVVREELKPIETRLAAVEGKVAGIDRRLDTEAMRRDDEKLPARVARIEKKVFGTPRTSGYQYYVDLGATPPSTRSDSTPPKQPPTKSTTSSPTARASRPPPPEP